MSQIQDLETLANELNGLDAARAKERFTQLFARGCELLVLDDDAAAILFHTSRPTASRWRRGVVVPPGAPLLLEHLHKTLIKRIRSQKSFGGSQPSGYPMAAKAR